MDAVREQRALVERTGAREPLDDPDPVARHCVALVGAVLGCVHVQAASEFVRDAGTGGERLVARA